MVIIRRLFNCTILVCACVAVFVSAVIVEDERSVLESVPDIQERFNQDVGRATPIAQNESLAAIRELPVVGNALSQFLDLLSQIPIVGSVESVILSLQLCTWAIYATAAGYLCGRIIRGRGFGIAGNFMTGVFGSTIGTMILRLAGLETLSQLPLFGGIVAGVFGATVLVHMLRLIDHTFAR